MKVARQTATLVFAATDTVKTVEISQNGYLTDLQLKVANFATAATLVVTIIDRSDKVAKTKVWYTSGAIAKNTVSVTHPTNNIPVDVGDLVVVTLNDVAGAGGGNVEASLAIMVR